jgi:branched-chain amino acid aminotransferase
VSLAFHNGRFVPYSDLHIPPHDAGFVFGATVTDFCRTYRHRLFRWPDHLARLRRDCTACYVPLPYTDADLTAAAEHLVSENAKGLPPDDDLALITFATPGPLGYMLGETNTGPPTVAMHTFPIPKERYRRFFTEGIVLSFAGLLPDFTHPLSAAKHRSRIHWWAGAHAGIAPSGTTPVLVGVKNELDTAVGSVLAVRDGVIERPTVWHVLNSISVTVVSELAERLGIEVRERAEWPFELNSDDISEMLLVGSAFGVAGVRTYFPPKARLDFPWPGPVFTKLAAAWSEMVGLDVVKQFTG